MSQSPKIGVLVSGNGSNLQALIDHACKRDNLKNLGPVISDNPHAFALERARLAGLACDVVLYPNQVTFEDKVLSLLEEHGCNWIFLAGFMKVLSTQFVQKWHHRIINIHPSLLPDYKGLNTHQRVLADGCSAHGCSLHIVTPNLDEGQLLAQATLEVDGLAKGEDAACLAKRVHVLEHYLYPMVLDWVLDDMVLCNKENVVHKQMALPIKLSEKEIEAFE